MKKLFFVLFLIVIGFLTLSCEDKNEIIVEPNATLIWTGDYAVDGCGFFVEIDSVEYKPENEEIIPPAFKVDYPLSVSVQYIDLLYDLDYYCGDSPDSKKAKAIKLTFMDLNGELKN